VVVVHVAGMESRGVVAETLMAHAKFVHCSGSC
jgi:hypothetical protein